MRALMSDHLNQMTPAAALLGREVVEADKATGQVRVRFLAKHEFTNRHGTVQGGFLAAMLDAATGNAVVCTENLIRVDDVMESPKLAE
jgi:acyl-coenzyme A thioesterase PaaI-like protein